MDASSWTNNASYAIDIAEKHHLSQTTSSDVHTTAEKRRFKLNPREREKTTHLSDIQIGQTSLYGTCFWNHAELHRSADQAKPNNGRSNNGSEGFVPNPRKQVVQVHQENFSFCQASPESRSASETSDEMFLRLKRHSMQMKAWLITV